ncbi:MAG: SET domain-containing protein-lysine N-methyltransferase [Chloroflexi bacterium]|nr:SET domain-containing protein-lysine N-methyltransferase [Chloroflexota bacterium]
MLSFEAMDLARTHKLSDLELLAIQMDLRWGSEPGPDLVLACARDGMRARIGEQVPSEVARTLAAEIDGGTSPIEDLGAPPPQLERCRVLLEDALGAAVRLAPGSGPRYLIESGVSFHGSAELIRSDSGDPTQLQAGNPGNWGADEWQDLLDGRLGPWVIARQNERVISICHTPVANAKAADAGVWTHPEFRGHGHAAATTAEWAALMRQCGRLLFYGTSRTNRSSQRVAARLGLRAIGYLWQLQSMRNTAGWTDPRVRAGASTIEGNGLYASAPIRAGEVVFVWGGGTIISDAELCAIVASGRRYSTAAIGENQHILWSADDPDAGGPGGANHSCDSNLWMLDARTVGARREIAAGEELTLDYGLFSVAPEWRMDCYCGSTRCRGVVSGNDWRLPELQQRYAGHFSPFINARIAKLRRP